MPDSAFVFFAQGSLLLLGVAVVWSILAWIVRKVLALILRCLGIPATAERPPPTDEEFTRDQADWEEHRRIFDAAPASTDATERWLHDPGRLYGRGDGSGKW